jgi:hypothetical protein
MLTAPFSFFTKRFNGFLEGSKRITPLATFLQLNKLAIAVFRYRNELTDLHVLLCF